MMVCPSRPQMYPKSDSTNWAMSTKDAETGRDKQPASRLLAHVRVYLIAVHYDIQGLKNSAAYAVERVVEYAGPQTLCEVLEEVLGSSTDKWLTGLLSGYVAMYLQDLLERDDFVKLWSAHPDFALETT